MKKKIVVTIMAAVMSMSMLTACGKSSDRNTDEVESEQTGDPAGMVHIDTTEEVSAFFEEVYQGVAEDMLPGALNTTDIDLNDKDMVSYHTGLEDLSGIESISVSESMIGSVAYSAMYIRTNDDADATAIRQQLMDSVNPSKWICVTAEKEISALFGNDIFFVMGAQDTVQEVFNKASEAAKSRGMTVSDTLEKENPI